MQNGHVIRTKMGQALIKAAATAQNQGKDLGYLGKLVETAPARIALQAQRRSPALFKKAA
jgi:hypothetical protein